jgi:hypothetical protein
MGGFCSAGVTAVRNGFLHPTWVSGICLCVVAFMGGWAIQLLIPPTGHDGYLTIEQPILAASPRATDSQAIEPEVAAMETAGGGIAESLRPAQAHPEDAIEAIVGLRGYQRAGFDRPEFPQQDFPQRSGDDVGRTPNPTDNVAVALPAEDRPRVPQPGVTLRDGEPAEEEHDVTDRALALLSATKPALVRSGDAVKRAGSLTRSAIDEVAPVLKRPFRLFSRPRRAEPGDESAGGR